MPFSPRTYGSPDRVYSLKTNRKQPDSAFQKYLEISLN